ncbi:MAG TPA: pyridoxal-phosphate dependent enzyme, partial [Vicinamibacterales bacterium]|nr:pyridoxal-phosphate dependent enzyme [Vicinamibacterales bacterium]
WTRPPDVLLVQGGVGGLVCAAANWLAWQFGPARPFLIACEPASAACLLESARAGRLVNIADPDGGRQTADVGTLRTVMAGLRCAEPSPAAWPSINAGVDAFLSIPDSLALDAMARLSQPITGDAAIPAGPSGACGIGALFALRAAPGAAPVRRACGLGPSTRVMAVVTEAP